MKIQEKKIVFIDLDDTLIKTKSGKTFPIGIWDMELNMPVFEKLKQMQPLAIFIVSNQGGISLGIVPETLFTQKFMYVIASLQEVVGLNVLVAGRYCKSNDKGDPMRKPNAGMLNEMLREFEEQTGIVIHNHECLMVGDAGGMEKDFSDSDKRTAENFGCDFLHVIDLLNLEIPPMTYKVVLQDGTTLSLNDEVMDYLTLEKANEVARKHDETLEKKVCAVVPHLWTNPTVPVRQPVHEAKEVKMNVKHRKNK